MQQPVGYSIQDGRAVMTDFAALLQNPNLWVQFPHVIFSGLTTAAFFVLGISAYHLLYKKDESFRKPFRIAAIVGSAAVLLVIVMGHQQAQHIVKTQPMKMAAAEALWDSDDPAALSLFSIADPENKRNIVDLRLPRLLSLLSYNRLEGKVWGINDIQAEYEQKYGAGNYIPNIFINYWTFRIMVGLGFLMFAAALYALFYAIKKKQPGKINLLSLFPYFIALPYLANVSGWLLTEIGRQPWVVYGLLKTQDAFSPNLSSGMVLTSLIGFTLIYGLLLVVDVYLLAKYARAGLEPAESAGPNAAPEEIY